MRKKIMLLWGVIRLLKEIFWNGKKLKLKSYKYFLGRNVRINIEKGGVCFLGEKVWLSDNSYLSANEGTIVIGDNNYFNTNCKIIARERVEIGHNNLFGPNTVIVDHNHQYKIPEQLICRQGFVSAPIVMGSNIWIGANVTICSGVCICDRVIVGANSVVTKNITEPGIYGGMPARKIKDI